MKASNYAIMLLLISLISCAKILENDVPEYTMQVFDHNTTTPVQGVRVDMYRCANYDLLFGCLKKEFFATGYTDDNGKHVFLADNFSRANEGIVLTKAKYWEGSGGVGKQYIAPEGWLDIRLLRRNNYPDSSVLLMSVVGETGSSEPFAFRNPAIRLSN